MDTGLIAFRLLLSHPDALWNAWLAEDDVVDAEESGVVVATGVPVPAEIAEARRAVDALGWRGLLDAYWALLAEHDGVAIDQGGEGPPRVAALPPSSLSEPVIWPARHGEREVLADFSRPPDTALAFGELSGSGYLFFKKARAGLFGKRAEVWFYDVKEPSKPATKLGESFDEFLSGWVEHRLKLAALLAARGAAGWSA